MNCHGIKKFKEKFSFKEDNTKNTNISLIYAPNGTMKTSFAKTLRDLGNDIKPKNIISKKIRKIQLNF